MSSTESQTEPLALRPDVVATVLEDEAVLLDLESKYFYSVNAPGWAIVQLFENGTTVDHVRAQCRAWGAGPDDAAAIARFVEMLVGDRLLQPTQAPAASNRVVFDGNWRPPAIDKHREPLQRIVISAFDPTLPLAE